MRYSLVFSLVGLLLAAIGLTSGGWTLVLYWPATSFLALGAAYAGVGPRLLGKRPDGRLALSAVVLLLPYLLATWGVWHFIRLLTREPCSHEVAPDLWLGRRAFVRELPPGVGLIIDLTAEFAAPRDLGVGREYQCLPTLDAAAPDEALLREAVDKVVAWSGPVYVHCAQGHGRSALFVAAVLVRRGLAADSREAEEMLRRVRPGVRLTRPQRSLLERLVDERLAETLKP